MQPKQVASPPPIKKKEVYEDPMAHLWAVSYSDLLMVLMSFFVLFYQADDVIEGNPLLRLVAKVGAGNSGEGGASGTGRVINSTGAVSTVSRMKSLASQLNGLDVNVESSGESTLHVHLPDSIYPSGGFDVEGDVKKTLDVILKRISPHADELELIFVGHTDDRPVRPRPVGNVLQSNMMLSNLRAAKAARYAYDNGYDRRWVAARGQAEFSRNTRSLSIVLKMREGPVEP